MTLETFTVGPVFIVVALVSLVFAILTIVDMARRPNWQWQQAGSNKTLWLVLEIICFLLLGFISIVIGILYFAMIRPRLAAVERQGTGEWQSGGWPGQPGLPTEPPPGQPPLWTTQPYPPPHESHEGATSPPAAGPEASAPPPYPGGGPPPYPATTAAPPYPTTAAFPAGPPQTSAPPFGWYPDPSSRHEQRYWDGTRWTDHVADGGQQSDDPLPG